MKPVAVLHSAARNMSATRKKERKKARSYEPQSQRQNPTAHSLKNTSLVGHHHQTFSRLHSA